MDVLMLPGFSEAALIFMQTQGLCLGDMMGSFPTGPQWFRRWSPISKGEKAFKCVFADPHVCHLKVSRHWLVMERE